MANTFLMTAPIEKRTESEPETIRWYVGALTLDKDSSSVVLRGHNLDLQTKEIKEEAALNIELYDTLGQWSQCHRWAISKLGTQVEAHFCRINDRTEISFVYSEDGKLVVKTFYGTMITN